MDTIYNKEEDEYEGITLDYETSTLDTSNPGQIIDSEDETETTENFWKTNTKPGFLHFRKSWLKIKGVIILDKYVD